jgi:hypothetical protein
VDVGSVPRLRWRAAPTGALFAIVAAAYAVSIPDVWFLTPDSAVYLGLARSLARGGGYVVNQLPHGKYPPGFPLMLAAVYRTLGECIPVMLAMVALCGVGALAATYSLVRSAAGAWPARAVVLLAATSSWYWAHSTLYLLSGAPYACFSLLAVGLAERSVRSGRFRTRGWLLVVAVAVVALSIHMSGIALIAALALAPLRARAWPVRHRLAAAGLAALVGGAAAGGWLVHSSGLERDASYQSFVDAAPARLGPQILPHLRLRLEEWPAAALSVSHNRVAWSVGLGLLGVLVAPGLVRALRRDGSPAACYLAAYFLIMAVSGGETGRERYAVPIIPLLFYFGYLSVQVLGDWAGRLVLACRRRFLPEPRSTQSHRDGGRLARRSVVAAILGLSILSHAIYRRATFGAGAERFAAERRADAAREVRDWRELGQWVQATFPPGAAGAAAAGSRAIVHYFTERPVRAFWRPPTPSAEFLKLLEPQRIAFVVVDRRRESESGFQDIIEGLPERFAPLRSNEECRLYRVVWPSSRANP